jgi:hypothetical protein
VLEDAPDDRCIIDQRDDALGLLHRFPSRQRKDHGSFAPAFEVVHAGILRAGSPDSQRRLLHRRELGRGATS